MADGDSNEGGRRSTSSSEVPIVPSSLPPVGPDPFDVVGTADTIPPSIPSGTIPPFPPVTVSSVPPPTGLPTPTESPLPSLSPIPPAITPPVAGPPIAFATATMGTATHPLLPNVDPAVYALVQPAFDQLFARVHGAEANLLETQRHSQVVLQQLAEVWRRTEAAEALAAELHARLEDTERRLAEKTAIERQLRETIDEQDRKLAEVRTTARAASWVRNRLSQSPAPSNLDPAYFEALDDVAEGRLEPALDKLRKLVDADESSTNVHYRTALYLAEGFNLAKQGVDADLTGRFKRAELVELAKSTP